MDAAELEALIETWRRTEPVELDQLSPSRKEARENTTTLMALLAHPAPVDAAVHDAFIEAADFPDGAATYATCAADSRDP